MYFKEGRAARILDIRVKYDGAPRDVSMKPGISAHRSPHLPVKESL